MSDEIVKVETPEVPAKVEEQKQVPAKGIDFSEQIQNMLPTVGSIKLTDAERAILYAPVDPDLVEIRPDSIVYLPWTEYVTRLRSALGLEWGLIAIGFPKVKGDSVIGYYAFIVRQALVGFFFGEQQWSSSNRAMSFSDAVEGARSNALMRSCKALGLTLELWTPEFIRNWKEKYAAQGKDGKWYKKGMAAEDRLGMAAAEAIEATKEIFPGAEEVPPGTPPEAGAVPAPSPDTSPSALLFVRYHDEMTRLAHISILREYWTKNGAEAEAKLHPNHFKLLVELKDKLRQGFIDKKMKERGGTK